MVQLNVCNWANDVDVGISRDVSNGMETTLWLKSIFDFWAPTATMMMVMTITNKELMSAKNDFLFQEWEIIFRVDFDYSLCNYTVKERFDK